VEAMSKKKYEDLLARLLEQFELADEKELSALKRMAANLALVRQAIKELRGLVLAEGFDSEATEIWFFKKCKPVFLAMQIYCVELGTLEDGLPLEPELRNVYLKEQLAFVDRFFRLHAFYDRYYRLDATDLDRFYFLRNEKVPDSLVFDLPGADPEFSTAGDYIFAKLIAYGKLRDSLRELIKVREPAGESFMTKKGKALKWTGDTCNLIEVAYGFYDTLQLNEGDVDLTDIIDWLESTLNVNLSRFYRRFMEIKQRKVVSKTKYLDEMRAAVNKRIDDTDAYQVNKRKNLRNY
jgi:RteC protein